MDTTKLKGYVLAFIVALCLFSCNTNKQAIKSETVEIDLVDEEKLTWGKRDTSSQNIGFDGSGEGIFGRKIIYRDLGGLSFKNLQTGQVSMMVCINKEGSIHYAAILKSETTIMDKKSLIKYLKAGSGYKFQPDMTAPDEQCGKIKFKIDNSLSNKLR